MKFYLNDKTVSKKKAVELVGAEKLKEYIKSAKETFRDDPYISSSWYIGSGNMFSIEID